MAFFGAGIALSSVWALPIIPILGWRWALFLTAPFALIEIGNFDRCYPHLPLFTSPDGEQSPSVTPVKQQMRTPTPPFLDGCTRSTIPTGRILVGQELHFLRKRCIILRLMRK
jgi:MFS family permease